MAASPGGRQNDFRYVVVRVSANQTVKMPTGGDLPPSQTSNLHIAINAKRRSNLDRPWLKSFLRRADRREGNFSLIRWIFRDDFARGGGIKVLKSLVRNGGSSIAVDEVQIFFHGEIGWLLFV